MKKRKTVVFDMDGTLARFHEQANCLEKMWEKGFFSGLKPYENICEAAKRILNNFSDIQIIILTAINTEIFHRVKIEKTEWLKTNIGPKCNDIIFAKVGESKVEVLSEDGKINKDFILIDDYNKNLREWREAGGTSIKFVNEFNDKGTNGLLWDGFRIRYDFTPERIISDLSCIANS